MKGKQFLHGLSWLVVLNLLVKPIWVFGIDRKVQNTVGHEAFGSYFSILNLAIILAIVADAGLTNMLNRQLALSEQIHLGRLLRIKGALSLIYFSLLGFLCWITGVERWDLVVGIGALQIASSFLVFFRSVVTGRQEFSADAWLSITDKGLTILVCAPLLYLPFAAQLSLNTFIWIQIATTLAALIVAIILVRRHPNVPIARPALTELFRLSAPFVLLILLMGIHTRLDAFLLERLHPEGALQAGIYAAAYRLLDAGNTVGYMTASFLVPFAARHLDDQALINSSTLRLRHGLLAAAVAFVALCAAFAVPILQLLYHDSNAFSAKVLTACVSVLPAYYGIHIYGSLLTAAGQFRWFNVAVLGSVVLNSLLNLYFIPRWGALGCCWAALASQYLCAVACFIGARKFYRLNAHPLSLVISCLLGLAVYGVGRRLQGKVPGSIFWYLGAAIGASLFMFVLFKLMRAKRPAS